MKRLFQRTSSLKGNNLLYFDYFSSSFFSSLSFSIFNLSLPARVSRDLPPEPLLSTAELSPRALTSPGSSSFPSWRWTCSGPGQWRNQVLLLPPPDSSLSPFRALLPGKFVSRGDGFHSAFLALSVTWDATVPLANSWLPAADYCLWLA